MLFVIIPRNNNLPSFKSRKITPFDSIGFFGARRKNTPNELINHFGRAVSFHKTLAKPGRRPYNPLN
jgi:hypothetical protein